MCFIPNVFSSRSLEQKFFLKEKVSSSPITPLYILEWLPVTLLRKLNVCITCQWQLSSNVNTFHFLARQPLMAIDWNSNSHFHILHVCHSILVGYSCPLSEILISELLLKTYFIWEVYNELSGYCFNPKSICVVRSWKNSSHYSPCSYFRWIIMLLGRFP